VISDAYEGLKAAIWRVFGATWQRCRVHWMRNALAYVPKTQHALAPGGRLVFSREHPIFTAPRQPGWSVEYRKQITRDPSEARTAWFALCSARPADVREGTSSRLQRAFSEMQAPTAPPPAAERGTLVRNR
jgi:transposase-like protein